MRATGLLTELSLSPLEAADTAQLAEAISGRPLAGDRRGPAARDDGWLPAVHHRGDPRHRRAPAARRCRPGDLSAVLRKRLAQATEAAREVAGLAAAVGTNFTLDLLTEASDLDADVVVAAVDELWRRRILREFGTATTSPTTCCARARTRESARRNGGCCTGASPRAWNCCTPRTRTRSRPSSPSSTRGPGGPSGRWPTTSGPPSVAAGMFAHAEAIRLHQKALSIIEAMPAGRDRDARELAVLEAMAAPLNARQGYSSPDLQRTLERSITLAESLGRKDSTVRRPDRAVGHAVRAGANGRQPPDGHPRPGPRRPRVAAVRPGAFRRRRFGHQPGPAGGGAAAPGPGRQDGPAVPSGSASAPGPTCTVRPGPRTPTGCLARTTTARAGLPRGHRAGPGDR